MDPLLQTCFQHWFLQVLRTGSLDAGLLCKVLGLELGNLVCLGVDIGDEMRIQAFSVHYAGFKMSLLYQFLCFLMLECPHLDCDVTRTNVGLSGSHSVLETWL